MSDLISRQVAIEAVDEALTRVFVEYRDIAEKMINKIPCAQPTLYGYKIEHLAYIARVMEKEGVTADYAVRTFDDMSRVIKMIIDEARQEVEEVLNE